MTIIEIFLHHFGGTDTNRLAPTGHLTLQDIDTAHRARWPEFKSSLGYWVGYTGIIWPDGTFVQTRAIGEETAAVIGRNTGSISFCLAGNHLVEPPTWQQKTKLKNLMVAIIQGRAKEAGLVIAPGTILNVKAHMIYPHRYAWPNTECNALPIMFGPELVIDYADRLSVLWITLRQLQQQLLKLKGLPAGGIVTPCHLENNHNDTMPSMDTLPVKRFGALSSSVDPEKLGTMVQGLILGASAIIIFLLSKLGIMLLPGDIQTLATNAASAATQIAAVVSMIGVAFGAIRKVIVFLADRRQPQ